MGLIALGAALSMAVLALAAHLGYRRTPEAEREAEEFGRTMGNALNGIASAAPGVLGRPVYLPEVPPPRIVDAEGDHVLHVEAPPGPDLSALRLDPAELGGVGEPLRGPGGPVEQRGPTRG